MSNNFGLTHVTLKCNDFEKMFAFYRDVMGFEVAFTLPFTAAKAAERAQDGVKEGDIWLAYFRIAERQFIELFNEKYDPRLHIPEYSFMHYSVLVDDIIKAARHFEKCGLTLWAGPKFSNHPYTDPYPANRAGACGSYAFYIQDPEGNEIELMQYTPQSLQLTTDV